MDLMGSVKHLMLLLVSSSLIASFIASSGVMANVQASDSSYATHAVITVDGDAGLAALEESGGCTGSGTADDPYVISGYDIAGADGKCIYVKNTDKHLVIRDCYLHGAVRWMSDYGAGVQLINVKNATISNVIFGGNDFGIVLDSSSGNVIENNTVSGSTEYGIMLAISESNRIQGNVLTNNNGASSVYDPAHVQAYDQGGNFWNSSYGNLWSDWTAPDTNGDGIVDSPYVINENSADRHPLVSSLVKLYVIIATPIDGSTTNKSTVLVTGMANPFGTLVVNGIVVYVESNGQFSVRVALEEGANVIEAASVWLFRSSDSVTITYVNEMRSEIDELGEHLRENATRLSEAQAAIDATNAWLSSVSDTLVACYDAHNATADEVASMLVQVQTMKTSLVSLRASLDETDANATALASDLDDVIAELTSSETTLTAVQQSLTATRSDVSALKGDSLPLAVGSIALLGVVALASFFLYTRKNER